PVRTLHWVRVRRAGQLVTIDVAGDAFLRGMVRRIVAVLLEVGDGSLAEAAVREALASRRAAPNGAGAPARGLCLQRVVLGRPMKKEPSRTTGSAAQAADTGAAKQEP